MSSLTARLLLSLGAAAGAGAAPPRSLPLAPWHEAFLSLPSNESEAALLRNVTSRPHLAGTEGDAWTAAWVGATLASYGLNVSTASFDVMLSYPKGASLAALPPFAFNASLRETLYDADPQLARWEAELTPT